MMNKVAEKQNNEMEQFMKIKQQQIQTEIQAAAAQEVSIPELPRASG